MNCFYHGFSYKADINCIWNFCLTITWRIRIFASNSICYLRLPQVYVGESNFHSCIFLLWNKECLGLQTSLVPSDMGTLVHVKICTFIVTSIQIMSSAVMKTKCILKIYPQIAVTLPYLSLASASVPVSANYTFFQI